MTFPLEITVFVYPRIVVPGGAPEDHFRAALSDIYHYHPQARLERSGAMRLPFSTEQVEALSAFVTFVDQGKDLGSWLIVLAADDFIVKVRATYERSDDEGTAGLRLRQSFAAMESILQSIQRQHPASVPSQPLQATRAVQPNGEVGATHIAGAAEHRG